MENKVLSDSEIRKQTDSEAMLRLEYDIFTLFKHYDFFAHLLSKAIKQVDYRVPVASMNISNYRMILNINPHGYLSYHRKQRIFILIHEIKHFLNLHISRRTGYKDFALANVCMDIEINQFIENDIAVMPPDLLLPKHYDLPEKLTFEQYYEILINRGEQIEMPDSFKQGSHGKHLTDNNCPECEGSGESKEEGDNSECEKCNGTGRKRTDEQSDSLASDFKDLHPTWDDEGTPDNEEIARQITESVVEEAVTNAAGNIPGMVKHEVEQILDSKINWRKVVRNFPAKLIVPRKKRTFAREHRVLGDLVMGSYKIRELELVVCIDTSLSISESDLSQFNSELKTLKNLGVNITIIEIDTKVNACYTFKRNMELTVVGRGGTDFRPAFDYINNKLKQKPDAVFFLTDGYGCAPKDFNIPSLWVLTKQGAIPYDETGKPIDWKKTRFIRIDS